MIHLIDSYQSMVGFMAQTDWGWRDDLEDIIDVGMIAVWEATQKIDIDRVRSSDAYVAMVVRGRMRNYCAKMMHRDTPIGNIPVENQIDGKVPGNDDLSIHSESLSKYVQPAENVDLNRRPPDLDLKIDVANLLKDLSVKERLVLRLRFWEGWTQPEIAERLKCTKENVWYIEKQALARLKPAIL